jgi:hypothetical protein
MLAVRLPQEVGSGWNRSINGYLVKVIEQHRAQTPLYFLRLRITGRDALPLVFVHAVKFPAWRRQQGLSTRGRPLGALVTHHQQHDHCC